MKSYVSLSQTRMYRTVVIAYCKAGNSQPYPIYINLVMPIKGINKINNEWNKGQGDQFGRIKDCEKRGQYTCGCGCLTQNRGCTCILQAENISLFQYVFMTVNQEYNSW